MGQEIRVSAFQIYGNNIYDMSNENEKLKLYIHTEMVNLNYTIRRFFDLIRNDLNKLLVGDQVTYLLSIVCFA